jgi:hypothetical protein
MARATPCVRISGKYAKIQGIQHAEAVRTSPN